MRAGRFFSYQYTVCFDGFTADFKENTILSITFWLKSLLRYSCEEGIPLIIYLVAIRTA